MTITIMARTPTGDFLAAFEVTCRLIWTKNSNCRKLVRAILDHELTATQSVGMVNSSELVGNGCKVYLMRRKSPSYRSKRPYCLREVLPQSAGSWLKRADGRYEYVPAAQPSLAMN